MDKNFEIVTICLKDFIKDIQSFSFFVDKEEKDGTILVSYKPDKTLSDIDEAWDRLYDLKNYLISILPDGNILFSEGDTLFSVSDDAIGINSIMQTGVITISVTDWVMGYKKTGLLEKPYISYNESYCLAA